jgi:transcriptional regulator with XRE-family HTH domain
MSSRAAPQIPYTALVGQILMRHRVRLGLHQVHLAAALGISQPAYSRIEQGGTSISIGQLRIIARQLNVLPARILHEAEVWTQRLNARGVTVTDEKEVSKSSLVVALGILAAILAASA